MTEFTKRYKKRRKNKYSVTYDFLSPEALEAFNELLDAVEEATAEVAIDTQDRAKSIHPNGYGWNEPVLRMVDLRKSEGEMMLMPSAYGVEISPMDGHEHDVRKFMLSWHILSPYLKRTPEEYAMTIVGSANEKVKSDVIPLVTGNPDITLREYLGFEMKTSKSKSGIPAAPAVIFPIAGVYHDIKALRDL